MNTKIHCWDDETRNGRGDGECMSIKSYEGWNRCVAPCGIETENKYNRGKSKPYEPKKWVRPRPYVYPWCRNDLHHHPHSIMDRSLLYG